MRFSSLLAIVACLAITNLGHAASAKVQRRASVVDEVAEMPASGKPSSSSDSQAADVNLPAWLKVQIFSLLNTYSGVLETSVDKIDQFLGKMHMEPDTGDGFDFDYSVEIGKELDFMLHFSYSTAQALGKIGENKVPSKLPEKIPDVTEIAQLLHKIGDVFKTLWGKASVIESSAFDKDCLPKLPDIAEAFCQIIKWCFKWIKELIPECFKGFVPDFDQYMDLGYGLQEIVKTLKSFYPGK